MFDLIKTRAANLRPHLRSVPGRFPHAIAAAAAFLAVGTPWRNDDLWVWFIGLTSVFFWSIALRVGVEAVAPRNPGILNAVPAVSAVALLPALALADAFWIVHALPAAAGVLAVVAAPVFSPADRRARNETAWPLGVLESAAIAAIRSALILIGAASLAGAVDALANTRVLETLLDRPLWTICLSTVVVSFLARLPSPADQRDEPPPAKWFAGLVEFFLAPTAIAFLVIVNAYCLHPLLFWSVPKGVIAKLVISYVLIGGVVWSLAHSIGGGERSFTRTLRRVFLPGLAAPSIALLIAVATRIDEHGVTEGRYLLMVIGSILAALGIVATGRVIGPPRVAAALAVSLLAATLGPWSAVEVSLRSQTGRLWWALERARVINDGVIVAQRVGIAPEAWNDIRSKVLFLIERGEIEAVLSRFEKRPDLPKEKNPNFLMQFVVSAMGVETSDGTLVTLDAKDQYSASVRGYACVMSGYVVPDKPREFSCDDEKITAQIDDRKGALSVFANGEPAALFDVGRTLRDRPRGAGEPAALDASTGDGRKIRLLVRNARGLLHARDDVTVQTVTFTLLLGERPPAPARP